MSGRSCECDDDRYPSIDPTPAGFTGLFIGAIVVLAALIAFLMFREDSAPTPAVVTQTQIDQEVERSVSSARYYFSSGMQFVRMPISGPLTSSLYGALFKRKWEKENPGKFLFLCSYGDGHFECIVTTEVKQ
jgi:hypothetical protein